MTDSGLRVDELAARAGVSVDTIRYYQSKGLLPPPTRNGRVALYSDDHAARLVRIRALKDQGFNLISIARFLDEGFDPADQTLVAALAAPVSDEAPLSAAELASATGVSPVLLEALERQGLLVPDRSGGEPRYSRGDISVIEAGLALLQAGVPLDELLALARDHDDAMRRIARRAVDIFLEFVRDPIRAASSGGEDTGERLLESFRSMLPATTDLVSAHFRRVLLEEARARAGLDGG